MNILVVGGAGYIGSHMVKMLARNNYHVVTFDNLSTGYRDAVLYGDFFYGDLENKDDIERVFKQYKFDVVMHFASFIQVGESVIHPDKYYENNFINTMNLLNGMVRNGVKYFVFSSTAAIFGEPEYIPIDEKHPKQPVNPYGKTKLMVEQALEDYDKAYGLKSVSLRYFNAAGADPEGELGERHNPETHLIPLILQAASGRRECIKIFGKDYKTQDGTCVRDYIHIQDLCNAHMLAIKYLNKNNKSGAFNLGNGNGFSVKQVIDITKEVTGNEFSVIEEKRREGDPAQLVANSECAKNELKWQPQYADLTTIIQHAWNWEQLQSKSTD